MKGKKIVVLLTLLMFASAAFNLPSFYGPSTSISVLKPQTAFAPPSNEVGTGQPMNLTDSVNERRTLDASANNTRIDVQHRNTTFSRDTIDGFPIVWQNLTLSQLTATYDAREVQGGSTANTFFAVNGEPTNDQGLAMRFTTLDKVNLTGVWIYYKLTGTDTVPLSVLSSTTGWATPAGSNVSQGTVEGTGGAAVWRYVGLNSQVTITRVDFIWIVVNASSLSSSDFFEWGYKPDSGGVADSYLASRGSNLGGWVNEFNVLPSHQYLNFMLMLKVLPVGDDLKAKVYSSPSQVNMYLNSTSTMITNNSTRVDNGYRSFTLCANTSVTFAARWDARFEKFQLNQVATRYDARGGLTFWNATFASGAQPSHLSGYTLYNRSLNVHRVSQYWEISDPISNVTNDGAVPFTPSFSSVARNVFITQNNDVNSSTNTWVDNWLIRAKSAYSVKARAPSSVVEGLPLTVNVSTGLLFPSHCNVTLYEDDTGNPVYSRILQILTASYPLQVRFNETGSHTVFLFDKWDASNEVSLNKTLTINVLEPLCNVTVNNINSPILGNPATAQLRFLNGTAGWAAMPPLTVLINGTNRPFTYGAGITTVSWSTASGNWRSGLNQVNITAISGVFFNSTIYPITILPPNAKLLLNATSYSATYGDSVPIRFTFLNLTGGGTPFPSPPTLYRNGSSVSLVTDLGGGSYLCVLSTRSFAQAGSYHLNFTAKYGTYVATNITSFTLNKLVMTISLQLDQTSVTAGSSLSASATLRYPNGTAVEDLTSIVFRFTVTHANGTVRASDEGALMQNGVATSALTTNGNMTKITVEAIYGGDGIRTSASDVVLDIPVTLPTSGFPVIVVAGVAGIAVFAALIPIALRARRRKGREEEHRKTAVLRQTASLAQLVVVDLKSGRCVFSRSLGSEESVDPNLISGFLSANQSILEEVFKNKSKAGLRFADYGDYKVISHVGNYIMATLFATESAGEELKGVLDKFTDSFEKKYGKALQSWDGNVNAFKDAEEITDEVFALQLTAPYMVLEVPSAKLSKNERAAMHFARILSAERGVFFMPRVVDYLLTKQGLKRGQAMDAINSLTKKGILRQLTLEQAAQVVQSTLEKSGSQT